MTHLSPERAGRITGSRVAAVLGVDPYKSADDVLREMVRQHFGEPDEFQPNPATEWGIEHEPEAVYWYEETTGNLVDKHTAHQEFVGHPQDPRLGVTPDGLVGPGGIVEVKCPLWASYSSIRDTPHYEAQIQLQLECTGRAWCDFVIWRPSGGIVERVDRNPWWLESHCDAIERFINLYRATVAEAADVGGEHPLLMPLVDERTDREWVEASARWLDAIAAVATAERAAEEARDRLVDLAGGQKTRGAGALVQVVESRGSVDYKAIVAKHGPDGLDVEAFRKPGRSSVTVRRAKP